MQQNRPNSDTPALESCKTSATDKRGGAICEEKLERPPPSRYTPSLTEDCAATDCSDNELPKLLWIGSFMLKEETDEFSSLELS